MPAPYRRVGRVTRAHGTTGEVSVALRDGLPSHVLQGIDVWVVPPPADGAVSRRVDSLRGTGEAPIVRLSGANSPEAAHALVGRWVLASEDSLPPLPAEARTVVGYAVVDVDRGDLGTISDIIVTGANDVFVVTGGPYGEVLLPVIDDVVLSTDHDSGTVTVRLLDGLIEDGA